METLKPVPAYVGGTWEASENIATITNPYSGKPVGNVCLGDSRMAKKALLAAKEAYGQYKKLPAHARAKLLGQILDGIQSRQEEFAKTIALECGKPILDAQREVARSLFVLETAKEEAKRLGGELIPLDLLEGAEGRVGVLRRFPLGVVFGITPFNFPLNLVVHKVAPALAAGNTIIIKPASKTPLTALLLAEVVETTDLPKGAFSVIPLSNDLAEQLALDEDVKKVTFTGSAAVGWRLKALMPKKRVTLELGGNAGVIVHEDADFDFAVKRCVAGSFGYAGQTCISIQRIYVHEPLYERFKEAFVEGVKALKLGDPLDPQTQVGPMITPSALEGTLSFIEEAISRGARLLVGGKRRENILEPTVLEKVEPSMRVVCEEAFAPVVNLIPYSDFEEALAMVNNSAYGLQAGVFTSDIARVFQAYETLEVGGVIQGDASNFRVDPMPYGGVKDSGFGREGVRFAIEEMTEPKLLVLNTRAGMQEGLAGKTPPGE